MITRPRFVAFGFGLRENLSTFEALGLIKSKLRVFSISLVIILVITSSGLVFGAWYLKRLEDTITDQNESRPRLARSNLAKSAKHDAAIGEMRSAPVPVPYRFCQPAII